MLKLQLANGNTKFFAKGAKEAGDQIWVSRYLAERNAEKYGLAIEWHLSLWAQQIGMVLGCT